MSIELSNRPQTTSPEMTSAERTQVKGRLEGELVELAATRVQLRAEIAAALVGRRGVGTDESEDPEGSSLAFEQAQTNSLLQQSTRHAAEVSAAIIRLDRGTYGVCQECDEPISAGRLDARPATAFCIQCAS